MDVSLVMFKADGTRREFPLSKSRVIVGRKNSCDLRIPLNSVSRQHCELTVDGDTLKVRDLGSSNGTYHNSERVQEADLGPGDELVIGPVVFTVMIDGEPTQIEPVRTILGDSKDTGLNDSLAGIGPGETAGGDDDDDDDDLKPYDLVGDDDGSSGGSSERGALDLDDPLSALEALDPDGDGSSVGEFEFLADDEDEK